MTRHYKIASDIYDLIRGAGIAHKKDSQLTDWDILTRTHHAEATTNIKKLLKNKTIEVFSTTDNHATIKIGKKITITITIQA